ncbi:MAG: transglycosylase SLT domain-containing protein [bacterium]|nr:lytic murein transglycosylase [Gammaproteobacteria bacterium]HIL99111.1 lytic murein transglycosylase [Pseudomonadales bacterium]
MLVRLTLTQTLLVFCICCCNSGYARPVIANGGFNFASPDPVSRFEQRKLYKNLIYLIKSNQYSKYRAEENKLANYPLYPYLEYTEKIVSMSRQSEASINAFVDQYQDTPLANKLLQNWLYSLAKRGEWKTLIPNYQTTGATDTNTCHYAYALHKVDRTDEAMDLAEKLWSVGFSQPDACNPIFKIWRDAGYLTSSIAWQRYSAALTTNKVTLSNYLVRFLSKEDKALANKFKLAHTRPKSMTKTSRYSQKGDKTRLIISHGLKRLARIDAIKALDTLEIYRTTHEFTEAELFDVYLYIAVRLARKPESIHDLDRIPINLGKNQELIESKILTALRLLDWSDALVHIHQLDSEPQRSRRWQYWKARILASSSDLVDQQRAITIYASLAHERGFYGFMAADIISQKYDFKDQPILVSNEEILSLEATPGIQRALELLTLDELTPARREWYFTTRDFSNRELQIAARVAQKWGWHKQAIQAMIAAKAWNDLDVRFPLAFQDSFLAGARRSDIPVVWSLAIARQESAFMPDARSSAGALGVMQLMPATAKYTARKEGLSSPSKRDLADPHTNIRIGSAYLGQMLRKFDHNRILASAAYNAGPNKVRSWLDDTIPLDVWVETIPFQETRSYVMNVLVFSAIYSRRLNQKSPLIYQHELQKFSKQQITSSTRSSPDNS